MAFAMLPCPYCGGVVAPADDLYQVCSSCGKKIHVSRIDLHSFADSVEREKYLPIIDMVSDDNLPKALSTIEEMIAEDESQPDSLFVRGMVYAHMGEDGKAASDWKKAIEMLDTFANIDTYVCLMSNSISHLILYKEREFISFEEIRYIDRLGDMLYELTGDNCKMILYTTVFRVYMRDLESLGVDFNDNLFMDIVPKLFRRIIEYHREYSILMVRIDEFLNLMDYDESTYEEDDNYELHLYYLVRLYLETYTKDMSEEDMNRIVHYWNDSNMKVLEDRFELIVSCIKNPTILDKLKMVRSGLEESDMDISTAVNDYVKMCLLLDNEHSDVAKVLDHS